MNIKNLDPNKVKKYYNIYKNILICYINYVTSNGVGPL